MKVRDRRRLARQVFDRFEAVGNVDAGDAITVVRQKSRPTSSAFRFVRVARSTRGALLGAAGRRCEAEGGGRSDLRASRLRPLAATSCVKNIVDQAAGSAQDLDDAVAALKVARGELTPSPGPGSRSRKIIAPFDGVVGSKREPRRVFEGRRCRHRPGPNLRAENRLLRA